MRSVLPLWYCRKGGSIWLKNPACEPRLLLVQKMAVLGDRSPIKLCKEIHKAWRSDRQLT
jgi:hypothetical protein